MRRRYHAASTRHNRAKALRQVLRWLWQYHGAPKLDDQVKRFAPPRPRNVCVTDAEKAAILNAAPPHIRLWILLCSDLAVRSGTALALNGEHYDPRAQTLTFKTKCDESLTLPVTAEIAAMLTCCDMNTDDSFVRQLWRRHHAEHNKPSRITTGGKNCIGRVFTRLLESLHITRKLRPHDFRRTTAVAMLHATGDIREVQAVLGHKNLQSTFWYLDHELRPVQRRTLELIKTPHWRKEPAA
jgi:integrase